MKSQPYGYAVRMAISWHRGGWKPCGGPEKCGECRAIVAKREQAGASQRAR
jgi:hypothetical protein